MGSSSNHGKQARTETSVTETPAGAALPLPWQAAWDYSVDFWQRNVLFWDVMRQRGNQYLEHATQPVRHVLRFDFEIVMTGRDLPRPVNYGLVRILPPEGSDPDPNKRPFVIIDPRAGHGPGIGGSKPDSQVGAILRAGHPCYFIGFLAEPLAGQTLEDVGWAQIAFIEHVSELHPSAQGKPCVIGNCQAGWAIMMLAAVQPETVGPLLIAGSPLSYWAGVRGKNPMRYVGGLLGGTWMTTLAGDIGNGTFDGAHLVANFENLNPAHTLWGKPYGLWSKVDSEAPRYLAFERWWGGHTVMGADEMQTIADELFVGNKLVQGEIQTSDGMTIDLRNIRSPIVVFCSHGDNITPPQQALHWILDLYRDVEEIRAYGQTIVYALHDDVGHLGVFVSSRVGKKEYNEFTENMDLIDLLPPGLYEVVIRKKADEDANVELAAGDYVTRFETRTLDDIRALGGQDDDDDRAFETVARISETNQGLYRTFVSPFVRTMATEQSASWARQMHPARLQYSVLSDQNPFMGWIAAAADRVRAERQPADKDNPFLELQKQFSQGIVTWLESYGDVRDRIYEQMFFAVYGSDFLQSLVGLKSSSAARDKGAAGRDPAHAALVREKIRDLHRRMNLGGPREAAVRAMIYVGLPEGRIDERAFGAMKRIHEEIPEQERLSLFEFKDLIRDQFFMLLIDEGEALQALPEMLPAEQTARQAIFDRVLKISTAAGSISETRRKRLRELAQVFGLDPDVAVEGKKPPAVPEKKEAPAAVARRAKSQRAPRRGSAARN